jgi:hypothetical protein
MTSGADWTQYNLSAAIAERHLLILLTVGALRLRWSGFRCQPALGSYLPFYSSRKSWKTHTAQAYESTRSQQPARERSSTNALSLYYS